MIGDNDTTEKARKELIETFKLFEAKFYAIRVCGCPERDVGMVMKEITNKLLGNRAVAIIVQAQQQSSGTQYGREFVIELVANNSFEMTLARSSYNYKQTEMSQLQRWLKDFSQQTLELECKSFVMGLHALDELRERINSLEEQMAILEKSVRKEKRKRARLAP